MTVSTWARSSPTLITQVAVENRLEATNTLTSLYCVAGELVCHFVSILFASFYATPGAVVGSGIASMQFGGDDTYIGGDGLQYFNGGTTEITDYTKRRSLRKLQDEETAATSEFDLSFDVDQGQSTFSDSNSGASAVGMAMSMVAAAGAFAML